MMSWIKKFFIWWQGPTFGTMLVTKIYGVKVGIDEQGNTYYRSKKGDRRWVIYNGDVEATRVPPEWHRWLHKTSTESPLEIPLKRQVWEKEHAANATGTPKAYFPAGSPHAEGVRPKADGDYEAWTPDEASAKI